LKYTKPPLTFEQQADQLIARGLLAPSRDDVIEKVAAVNYYRLSGYWYPFKDLNDPQERFQPNTHMETIWRRYTFDRQLRLLVMDAIERVEVAIRTRLVNLHTLNHGAFGYLVRSTLPGQGHDEHFRFCQKVREEVNRNREKFVEHYRDKYTSEIDTPLWIACETMTFGAMLTLYRLSAQAAKQTLALHYGVSDGVLESWLLALNTVRNICAHHGRLWNRVSGNRPRIPRQHKHPQWHVPVAIRDDRVFAILTVLRYLLRIIAPQSHWRDRLVALLNDYNDIPTIEMGFPPNWQTSPIWQ
jgi:abortive infection bacteriophage resistance protein